MNGHFRLPGAIAFVVCGLRISRNTFSRFQLLGNLIFTRPPVSPGRSPGTIGAMDALRLRFLAWHILQEDSDKIALRRPSFTPPSFLWLSFFRLSFSRLSAGGILSCAPGQRLRASEESEKEGSEFPSIHVQYQHVQYQHVQCQADLTRSRLRSVARAVYGGAGLPGLRSGQLYTNSLTLQPSAGWILAAPRLRSSTCSQSTGSTASSH